MAREDSATRSSPRIEDRSDERRAFPLVALFGSVSLVIVLAIGLALGLLIRDTVRSRAIEDAARTASMVANVAILPNLEVGDFQHDAVPLLPGRSATLDAVLGANLATDEVAGINLWNSQRRLVYTNSSVRVDESLQGSEALERSLSGETNTEESDLGELLTVYVPIRLTEGAISASAGGDGEVIGTVGVELRFTPVAAGIRGDTESLILALGLGLTFLYLALLRIVVVAANRIRRETDQNLFLANHDKLTGLLNRGAFVRRAAGRTPRSGSDSAECTLLLVLSLDRFEVINETLGHSLGDQLLAVFAERLTGTIRSGDLAARIGGAEFAAVLTGVDVGDMDLPLTALLERLHAPVHLENLVVDIRASLGVVVLDGVTPMETALQYANLALGAAKDEHTLIEFFTDDMLGDSADTLKLAEQVRDGIENDEFVLHYQPKYSLATGEVTGSEALVRWNHPDRGFVPPGLFMAAVEHLPVGRDLANHITDMAIRDAALWQTSAPISVAVNLSSRDVNDPAFSGYVAERLRAYKLPAERLTLELTEGSVLLNEKRAIQTLQELRNLGCGIAIDDFGSGYASLSYLVRLPATEMKIDQSFIRDLDSSDQANRIVRHCLDLAHTMGLSTVGEGIETPQIQARLTGLGCDFGQGDLYCQPQAFADFVAFLQGSDSPAGIR